MNHETRKLTDTLSYLYASAHRQKVEAERAIDRVLQAGARHGITASQIADTHWQRARMDAAPREEELFTKPLFAIPKG